MAHIQPTQAECQARDKVLGAVTAAIREDRPILLPPFDPASERPNDEPALLTIGAEQNPYRGTVGPYTYQFEGEEDLLHIIVTRTDLALLDPREAQEVVSFLAPSVPPALIWIKPGQKSHHFYFGHDHLLGRAKQTSNNSGPQSDW